MPKIYLYAEILTHIRQLTLHASVQTEKREGTKLDVKTDKKVISVTHEGETQRLYLPTQIKGDASVTFPLLKTTDISARVQIEDEHEWKCMINNEIEAPWMAADLSDATAIQCRHCKSHIITVGKIKQWKDLPSENWAELMDFWFCHKPHDEDKDHVEEAATAKGYATTSKLAIEAGVGMTDLVSFVLCADDCVNIKAAETQHKPDLTVLRCSKCLEVLGTTNQDENLVRLHKASIAISLSSSANAWISYPSTVFICAQILSLIEATALKKFVVHSPRSENELTGEVQQPDALLLWVFNPDIYYSCSAYEGNGLPTNAAVAATESQTEDLEADAALDKAQTQATTEGEREPKLTTQTNHRNPNNDDISQIYSESSGPRVVSGDIHLEIPLSSHGNVTETTSKTFSQIPIESMLDTETPLITNGPIHSTNGGPEVSEHHAIVQGEASGGSESQSSIQDQQDDHINLVHRAAKIFYKALPENTDPVAFLDQPANASSHEELYLSNPADLIALRTALEKSTADLPGSARAFQDWNVGLLDRYEKVPSGLGVMAENPLARRITAKDGRITRWSLGDGAEGLYA